jgi:hypothetical protein
VIPGLSLTLGVKPAPAAPNSGSMRYQNGAKANNFARKNNFSE